MITRFIYVRRWHANVHMTFGQPRLSDEETKARMAHLYSGTFASIYEMPIVGNLRDALKRIRWEAFHSWLWREVDTYRIAFSHDTMRLHIGPLFVSLRRPCANFQKDGIQRCRWTVCHWKCFGIERTRESWLTGFCDAPTPSEIFECGGTPS